eukprot:scaffold7401_cov36-Tisochrysis_lutea.AAC.1
MQSFELAWCAECAGEGCGERVAVCIILHNRFPAEPRGGERGLASRGGERGALRTCRCQLALKLRPHAH